MLPAQLRVPAGIALIAGLALLIYWPALTGKFVLDDDILLTESKLVHAPDGLYKFWFTTEATDYWPITNSSFWLEWRLWRDNPTGYHVTNLILHITDALLIWAVLSALEVPYAFVAALLFAVHPVNVQSVAWIAQRKNLLSLLFSLLSLLSYLRSKPVPNTQKAAGSQSSESATGSVWWYALSVFSFVLAMLSKGSVAVFPLLLLLIVWWQQGRLTKRDVLKSLPFFLVAALFTLVNVWFRVHGAAEPLRDATFIERLLGAAGVVWFYLKKALLPFNLSFAYPQWHVTDSDWRWWLPLLAVFVTTVVLWSQRRRLPAKAALFAWVCFCVALSPVMGFIDVGFMNYSLVADHYQHIALIALLALVASGFGLVVTRFSKRTSMVANSLLIFVVSTFTLLAWQQSDLYASQLTLYADTLQKNPNCAMIHNNLAVALAASGDLNQAVDQCQQALALKPNYPRSLSQSRHAVGKNWQRLRGNQTLGTIPGFTTRCCEGSIHLGHRVD